MTFTQNTHHTSEMEFKISLINGLLWILLGCGVSTNILEYVQHSAETLVSHTFISPRDEL